MSKKQKDRHFGICRLCLKEKELIRKSHVISKFLLRRILNKDNSGFATLHVETGKSRPVQDAAYEPGILCKACDGSVLAQYEAYASKLLFGNEKDELPHSIQHFEGYSEVSGIDYNSFKLFVLSLVWRASISSTISDLKLDSSDEENMRLLLLKGLYSPENEYPIFLSEYLFSGVPKEVILQPWISAVSGGKYFHFPVGGFDFVVFIKDSTLYENQKDFSLRETGSLRIRPISPEVIKGIFNGYLKRNYFT